VQYREGIGHVVVATKSEHQTSCSVEYGLKASLEINRKSDKHKVAVVEPGVDERDHEGTEAVVGDVDDEAAAMQRNSMTRFYVHGTQRQGRCRCRRPSHERR